MNDLPLIPYSSENLLTLVPKVCIMWQSMERELRPSMGDGFARDVQSPTHGLSRYNFRPPKFDHAYVPDWITGISLFSSDRHSANIASHPVCRLISGYVTCYSPRDWRMYISKPLCMVHKIYCEFWNLKKRQVIRNANTIIIRDTIANTTEAITPRDKGAGSN